MARAAATVALADLPKLLALRDVLDTPDAAQVVQNIETLRAGLNDVDARQACANVPLIMAATRQQIAAAITRAHASIDAAPAN